MALVDRDILERIYREHNRPEMISPDPLQFLRDYDNVRDREVAALVASSLAYGRVAQIIKSVACALKPLGPGPATFLGEASPARLKSVCAGFRHRFADGANLAALLFGARAAIRSSGSLEAAFADGLSEDDETLLPALERFVRRLDPEGAAGHLLPAPSRGSACKRLHLFMRWMVRSDDVDPGGWTAVSPRHLIVPLDTHMHAICRMLGLTSRAAADGRAAIQATDAFRRFSPDDPVKYDFALTRFGIHPGMTRAELLRECRLGGAA